MPRSKRIIIPGLSHHISQRGNNHQNIFLEDEDRMQYLDILEIKCEKRGMSIIGFCLMTNHLHIIGIPLTSESLSQTIGQTHRDYAQWFNSKYRRDGHLWQSRYHSCALDESHLVRALIYVDRNPVRAGIVDNTLDYRWSSAKAHMVETDEFGMLDFQRWRKISVRTGWKELLKKEDSNFGNLLRIHTASGVPLASEDFIIRLEKEIGKPLRIKSKGRPIIR